MAGLFDYEYQLEKINAHKPPLQKLDSVIDWEMFRTPIETALHVEPKAPGGRPPYDRVMMFKITILQQYYNLSDEQTEFQIKDRLSFMQFLGLQIGDDVPDDLVHASHDLAVLEDVLLVPWLYDERPGQLLAYDVLVPDGRCALRVVHPGPRVIPPLHHVVGRVEGDGHGEQDEAHQYGHA